MTEGSDQIRPDPDWDRRGAGCLGAFLVHPVALGLAFTHGYVYGSYPFVLDARPGHGVDGGLGATRTLVWLYAVSLGILPLAISAVGVFIGLIILDVLEGRHD